MANLVAKIGKSPLFLQNFAILRSDLKCSKSLILNCAPLFVRLRDRHNILLMNTVKTSSSSLPPPPVSSTDNKKNEKQSRTRQKTVKVNAGISEHDLNIKMSHMSEWLEKGFHVSVFILKTAKQPEVGEKMFSQLVNAFKDTATVKHARKTTLSMHFQLQPNSKPSDTEMSNDDATRIESSASDKLFTLDKLRKLRSEAGSSENDKS